MILPFEVLRFFACSNKIKNIAFSRPKIVPVGPYQFFYQTCQIVSSQNTAIFGYGIGDTAQESQSKAFMECIERHALENALNIGNGTGAHVFKQSAKIHSMQEAIERDAYLRWALGASHLTRKSLGTAEIVLLELKSIDQSIKVAIAGFSSRACTQLGFGAANTIEIAEKKALQEMVISIVRHTAEPCEKSSSELNRIHSFSRSTEFKERFFREPASEIATDLWPSYSKNDFIFERLPGVHRWPIQVVQCINPGLLLWTNKFLVTNKIPVG